MQSSFARPKCHYLPELMLHNQSTFASWLGRLDLRPKMLFDIKAAFVCEICTESTLTTLLQLPSFFDQQTCVFHYKEHSPEELDDANHEIISLREDLGRTRADSKGDCNTDSSINVSFQGGRRLHEFLEERQHSSA